MLPCGGNWPPESWQEPPENALRLSAVRFVHIVILNWHNSEMHFKFRRTTDPARQPALVQFNRQSSTPVHFSPSEKECSLKEKSNV
jgi:hypothetical protein